MVLQYLQSRSAFPLNLDVATALTGEPGFPFLIKSHVFGLK